MRQKSTVNVAKTNCPSNASFLSCLSLLVECFFLWYTADILIDSFNIRKKVTEYHICCLSLHQISFIQTIKGRH